MQYFLHRLLNKQVQPEADIIEIKAPVQVRLELHCTACEHKHTENKMRILEVG